MKKQIIVIGYTKGIADVAAGLYAGVDTEGAHIFKVDGLKDGVLLSEVLQAEKGTPEVATLGTKCTELEGLFPEAEFALTEIEIEVADPATATN